MVDKPEQYRLSVSLAAKADLRSIYLYGLDKWGKKRIDKYLESIKLQFKRLLVNPLIGREHSNFQGIHSVSVESHTMFYRVNDTEIEIIRVLHKRQYAETYSNF